jgi:hypothetical protein
MPRFPLPEILPEAAGSMSRESTLAASEDAAAREPRVHPDTGGSVPVSVTPQTFGLGTGPVSTGSRRSHSYGSREFQRVDVPGLGDGYFLSSRRVGDTFHLPRVSMLYRQNPDTGRYEGANWTARATGDGGWKLGNAPALRTASTDAQAGPSRASSSQAAAVAGADAPHELEDLFENPVVRAKTSWSFHDSTYFHRFNGETLPHPFAGNPLQKDVHNRLFLGEQFKSIFREHGYEVTLDESDHRGMRLNVVNPGARDKPFQVHVKLSGDGRITPSKKAPTGKPYLVALVIYNPFDGALEKMHVFALQHPRYWRPWLKQRGSSA